MSDLDRLNAEWVTINAFRGFSKIASQGDMRKSTYDVAIQFGESCYPELLGETSLINKARETDTVKRFKQRAEYESLRDGKTIEAVKLIEGEIEYYESLIQAGTTDKKKRRENDQLKKTLSQLQEALSYLTLTNHTEHELIFRDAEVVNRVIPSFAKKSQGYRDFELPNGKVLRLRVLHPDKIEHITGADLIYERHSLDDETIAIVAVQYKIWEKKVLYLNEERLQKQLSNLSGFLCEKGICAGKENENSYRFPCCSAFIRPTDKLQNPNQALLSTGEYLPICKIKELSTVDGIDTKKIALSRIKDVSLSNELFEFLFNRGKIGSRELDHEELKQVYSDFINHPSMDRVIIYAQEFEQDI